LFLIVRNFIIANKHTLSTQMLGRSAGEFLAASVSGLCHLFLPISAAPPPSKVKNAYRLGHVFLRESFNSELFLFACGFCALRFFREPQMKYMRIFLWPKCGANLGAACACFAQYKEISLWLRRRMCFDVFRQGDQNALLTFELFIFINDVLAIFEYFSWCASWCNICY
jgi:hypothetical protein